MSLIGLMVFFLIAGIFLSCRPGMDRMKVVGLGFLSIVILFCLVVMIGHLSL